MKVPRYTCSMPVQKEFITNADACGDHVFTQLRREGDVCLYKRTRCSDGTVAGYEIFIVKKVLAGAKLPGNNVVKNDYEVYPGKNSFGRTAWSVASWHEKGAVNMFNDKVKKNAEKLVRKSVDDDAGEDEHDEIESEPSSTMGFVTSIPKAVVENETEEIPTGEFTMVEFATANCLPPRGVVYNILHGLIARGLVKESRRVSYGRGRPTCLFVKA